MRNVRTETEISDKGRIRDVIFMNGIEAADRRNIKMMGANTREV